MPSIILKFINENVAKSAFDNAGISLDDEFIAFKGICSMPTENAYFVIINKLDISSLSQFEYDYSFPVTAGVIFDT